MNALVTVDPNVTLPVGLTDAQPELVIPDRALDRFFDQKAEALSAHYLAMCRRTVDEGYAELPFLYAKAAAHWRRVAEDSRAAAAAIAVELIEVNEDELVEVP